MMDTTEGQIPMVRIAVFDATERRRYERELMSAKDRAEESERRARTLALTLQQTLIPASLPQIPGLAVAAAYRPSGDGTEVGGDFYDLFSVGNDSWAVLLGDVCGKGAEAAVVTARARNTVRALTVTDDGPARVLSQLNEVLLRHESERYCTVVLATLRPEGPHCRVRISVGGHPPPLLVSSDVQPVTVAAQGPLVGIFPRAVFADVDLVLSAGQTLLLHTDGVTEARGPGGYYGDERLLRTVAGLGPMPQTLVDGLVEDAVAFQGATTRDDIAVVAVGVPTVV
jgi:sigma-B regulation protein RsbU (phosphoserine phosphatase)